MAESLGAAVLTVSVDDAQLKAGLQAAERQAQTAGKTIDSAFAKSNQSIQSAGQRLQQAFTGAGQPIKGVATSLEALVGSQARAREAANGLALAAQGQAGTLTRLGSTAAASAASVNGLAPAFAGLNNTLRGLAGVAGIVGITALTQQLIATGQESQRAKIQLQSLAGAYGEASAAGQAASRIQKVLGISAVDATQGFAQLFASLRGTGIGLKQLEVLFVGVNNAARLSGATTAEASAGLLQLKQGLASGRFQGDELQSVLENLPALAQAVAAELNVNVGQLKRLGAEGKITSEAVFNAAKQLAGATAPGRTELEQLGIAFENVKAAAAEALGPALTGILQTTAAGLVAFKKFLEENRLALTNVARSVLEVGKTLAPFVAGILAVQAALKAWSIAGKAAAAAQAALLALQGPKGWAILAGAIGATGLATAALETTFKNVSKATGEAKVEAQAAFAEFQKLLNTTSFNSGGTVDPAKVAATQRQNAELAIGLETIQRQIDAENQLAQVAEGPYKEFLRQKLGIEETTNAALDQVRLLGAQLEELRAKGTPVDSTEFTKVLQEQQLAVKQLELVRAQGNNALVDAGSTYRDAVNSASKQAEDSFKQVAQQAESAAESLRGALEGSFNLLTPQIQKNLLSDARRDINQAISAGFFNPGAVALQTGSVQGILDVANKARGIDRANDQLASVTSDLVNVNSALTAKTGELVQKNWTVNVAVDANTGASEVQLG